MISKGPNIIKENLQVYLDGSAAATERANLIADHNWTITDGGSI